MQAIPLSLHGWEKNVAYVLNLSPLKKKRTEVEQMIERTMITSRISEQ